MSGRILFALALGAFAVGMTKFSMMGLLPDIAKELHVDIPMAGHLIASYALGVVIGAPLLVLITSKFQAKKVLITLMLLFVIFHLLFALASQYIPMLGLRFLSGLPHGAYFGVGSVLVAGLAKPGKAAYAISMMFTGMTLANLLGVPLGTFIGQHYSWRITYLFIAACGLLTLCLLYLWLPASAKTAAKPQKHSIAFFKTWPAWLLIAVISIGSGSMFAWLSYIAPLMSEMAMIPKKELPFIMTIIGLGMLIGNLWGGKLADRFSATKAAIYTFVGMALCLLVIYLTIHITFMAYLMAFITGIFSFTMSSPLQMMLIQTAKNAKTLAAAAGHSSFNLGNTFGTFFGGLPLSFGFAYNSPLLVGAGMASMGVILACIFLKKYLNNSMGNCSG